MMSNATFIELKSSGYDEQSNLHRPAAPLAGIRRIRFGRI
jgi:hypothetical protein